MRCFSKGDGREDRARPHGRQLGPGYYYVLFDAPDGIRLEVNFVPGAGLLADGAQLNPVAGYRRRLRVPAGFIFSGGPYTPVPVFVYFSRFVAVELAGVGAATTVFSHL